MKYLLVLLTIISLGACSSDNGSKNKDPHLVSDEVFKMNVGDSEVYGVRLRLTSNERQSLGYAISLSQNEKVWLDTVYSDITPGDTIENELIFSEAVVSPDDQVQVRTEAVSVE